ncbi:hypothetical protein KAJ61_02840 [Candidatus Parcubacteria bacterium]|nr:hypothetical protein [Candidatus Parcubacteria bacterium]
MELVQALIIQRKPLILCAQYSGNKIEREADLTKAIVEAINFTRAAHNFAQIVFTDFQGDYSGLVKHANNITESLKIEDEICNVYFKRIDDYNINITIEAVKL